MSMRVKVWHCDAPTKVVVLAWRLLINKLSIRDLLLLRGVVSLEHDAGIRKSYFLVVRSSTWRLGINFLLDGHTLFLRAGCGNTFRTVRASVESDEVEGSKTCNLDGNYLGNMVCKESCNF